MYGRGRKSAFKEGDMKMLVCGGADYGDKDVGMVVVMMLIMIIMMIMIIMTTATMMVVTTTTMMVMMITWKGPKVAQGRIERIANKQATHLPT